MKFKSIKGTKDILPGEAEVWQRVEESIRHVMSLFNYREIRTPVFEQTSLFSRSIGELTDIVSKEMYTFTDRSEESITLRPEGTASALRAYIQHNVGEQSALTKLYYIGPMFRQERPQAGRLRQFHQFGAEALGSSSPQLDAEMMLVALAVYRDLGIEEFALNVNSVGCRTCRPPYKELLVNALNNVRDKLSPESQARIGQNPLRVLDSKDDHDRELTRNVPLMKDHLCPECADHFKEVQALLQSSGTPFHIDGRLVRGLDYYTKTAFEITSTALGSQDALAGGGRYDILVEELGGKPTPGVGFAAGMERLMMVLSKAGKAGMPDVRPVLFIATNGAAAQQWAFTTANALRSKGFRVEIDYLQRSLKAQMREANRMEARYALVIGETELQARSAKLKNMQTGDEEGVALDQIDRALTTL
ncbi:MAG TPA: histidine--tRNA ligase [Bacteroidetes bacterium]|nr:histidine--tRNA ligase [Bacteroidota bacterium]